MSSTSTKYLMYYTFCHMNAHCMHILHRGLYALAVHALHELFSSIMLN